MVKNWSDVLLYFRYEEFLMDITLKMKERGWNHSDLMRQSGIKNTSTWTDIRKQHQFMSLLTMLRLANALEMSIDKYRIGYGER